RVPSGIWSIIVSYATKLEIDAEVAMRVFMEQINALIAMGSISWLSPDWQAAIKPQQTTPTIDHARLHRSERTKSGFVGVYANGAGFRAVGRAGAYIGTFQSAEVAAWERYLHYTRAGLPYGEL